MPEEEDMKWLKKSELGDAESMDDEEDDPDWSSQLEDRGDDINADDEEKESPRLNNIRQVIMISCWHSIHITTFFPEKVNVKLIYLVGVRICWYRTLGHGLCKLLRSLPVCLVRRMMCKIYASFSDL